MRPRIYMDYHSTTPVDSRVLETMLPYFSEKFGNPSSRQHQYGWEAEAVVDNSRLIIANAIGAQPSEIIFTSGATESNNLAIKGVADIYRTRGNHIITVKTEHKSVLDVCKKLEKSGFQVTYLPVDSDGILDLNKLSDAISEKTILISVMIANNEIGTIQDIAAIGKLCHERNIFYHTDATQAIGKLTIDVQTMNIDLMSFSGHKIYGPKGIGVLYVRSQNPKVKLSMQIDGGGHERGLRSGTLNVPGIVGIAKAIQIVVASMSVELPRLQALRDKMFNAFNSQLDDVYLNGHPTKRLVNNLNMSFLHVDSDALMMSMKEIAVSTGSACSTSNPEPSHVLKALGLSSERLYSAIRFGLGKDNTEYEVDYVIDRYIETVKNLRKLSPTYNRIEKTNIL